MKITFVSGLYFYTRNGVINYPKYTMPELVHSLNLNPWYREGLVCYADTHEMADVLSKHGCYVHKVFDDAPEDVRLNTAHKMKHWIMLNAVKEFQNVVWVDWDTFSLKPIDDVFLNMCLSSSFPKFTFIHNYWATVNCSVYYLNESSIDIMERSFYSKVEVPNDELMWKSVLPENIVSIPEYWLKDYVVNIWEENDFKSITDITYFLHLKDFEMLNLLTKKQ